MRKKSDLKNVVWKEGKYYVAQCSEVDVSSFGKTKKEASAMLKEAVKLYFEDAPAVEKIETKFSGFPPKAFGRNDNNKYEPQIKNPRNTGLAKERREF